jgi:hypothetical protein
VAAVGYLAELVLRRIRRAKSAEVKQRELVKLVSVLRKGDADLAEMGNGRIRAHHLRVRADAHLDLAVFFLRSAYEHSQAGAGDDDARVRHEMNRFYAQRLLARRHYFEALQIADEWSDERLLLWSLKGMLVVVEQGEGIREATRQLKERFKKHGMDKDVSELREWSKQIGMKRKRLSAFFSQPRPLVVLFGAPASGKSTVGLAVASALAQWFGEVAERGLEESHREVASASPDDGSYRYGVMNNLILSEDEGVRSGQIEDAVVDLFDWIKRHEDRPRVVEIAYPDAVALFGRGAFAALGAPVVLHLSAPLGKRATRNAMRGKDMIPAERLANYEDRSGADVSRMMDEMIRLDALYERFDMSGDLDAARRRVLQTLFWCFGPAGDWL